MWLDPKGFRWVACCGRRDHGARCAVFSYLLGQPRADPTHAAAPRCTRLPLTGVALPGSWFFKVFFTEYKNVESLHAIVSSSLICFACSHELVSQHAKHKSVLITCV